MKKTPLLLLAAIPTIAQAQTVISQTQSFGSDVLSFADVLTFDQFDGDIADLLDVEIHFSLTVEGGEMIIDNDSDISATVDAMFGADLSVSSNDVLLLDGSFTNIFDDVTSTTDQSFVLGPNVGDVIGDFDPTGPDGATLVGSLVTSTGGSSVNSTFWSGYTGSGTFDLEILAETLTSIGAVGGVEFASTPATAQGSITVKYTTTAVPEPSTALLSFAGLLGLAARRRR